MGLLRGGGGNSENRKMFSHRDMGFPLGEEIGWDYCQDTPWRIFNETTMRYWHGSDMIGLFGSHK
jgi:hypothetical protein